MNKRVLVHKTDADDLFLDAASVTVETVLASGGADVVVRSGSATYTLAAGEREECQNYAAYLRGVCYGTESTGVPNMLLRESLRSGETVLEDVNSHEELVYPCSEQAALEYIAQRGAVVVDVSPYHWM